MTDHAPTPVPSPAMLLGLSGLIPFIGLAIAVWAGPEALRPAYAAYLASYGTVILSFMGGCRWGLAAAGMGEGPKMMPLAISVVPALWGWALTAVALPWQMLGLAVGLVALFFADVALTRAKGAPAWWPKLRLPLTAGATLSLIAGGAATI